MDSMTIGLLGFFGTMVLILVIVAVAINYQPKGGTERERIVKEVLQTLERIENEKIVGCGGKHVWDKRS